MKAGKCFYCEDHGDLAKDCPKKKGKQVERKDDLRKYDESQKKWKTVRPHQDFVKRFR